MLTRERQSRIRARLEAEGRVVAADLARLFEVSEDTVRRDLRELAAQGQCERVYGGAVPVTGLPPISARLSENRGAKSRLARATMPLLPEAGFVVIDAGSTNLAIAEAIGGNRKLTVMTNAPAIAAALSLMSDVELIMTGGRVDREIGGAIDAQAIASIEGICPDVFVVGACGVDPARGLFAMRRDEHMFKRKIAAQSRQVIAAVETAKFDAAATYQVTGFGDDLTLVVEPRVPPHLTDPIAASGARIVHAQEESSQ